VARGGELLKKIIIIAMKGATGFKNKKSYQRDVAISESTSYFFSLPIALIQVF